VSKDNSTRLHRTLTVLTGVLIVKVTLAILQNYPDYFPANLDSDFLRGRQGYFSSYRWPFYVHLISGPVSLMLALVLVSDKFRSRFPRWHRRLGRIQGMNVLVLLVPSGLWMSWYAATGHVAGAGFGLLSVATGICVAMGWRRAVQRRFRDHQWWMQRCLVLLCSAVVVRLIAGLATVLDRDEEWLYPLAAWASWLVPLAALEFSQFRLRSGSLPAVTSPGRERTALPASPVE
jgi:hypothetical protein